MLTITKTYTDFSGEERTEDFMFHLSKAELREMQFSKEGGLAEWLEKIVKSKNNPEIIRIFKQILLKSYGEVSEDKRRFVKSDKISEEFSQTVAYDLIFNELLENEKTMADFINGVMPKEVIELDQLVNR